MKLPQRILLSLSPTLLLLSGCGTSVNPSGTSTPASESAAITIASSQTSMEVDPASSSQCASGGSVITLYKDLNANSVYDAGDTLVSSTPVCNGAQGATGSTGTQGISAGVSLSAAAQGSCAAGGTVVRTFQDLNSNGVLDASEPITSTSTICNGIAGASGANGASSFITTTAASSAQCANGGTVYSTHVDAQSPQVNIVCNGANGTNGNNASAFASGAVGPAIAGKPFSACHHDYLYLPDVINGNRGWLIFRHQANGSADQGIGSTGFNVWNVDISDFQLVSEDLSVSYCQMHWDAGAKLLTYLVLDSLDGALGASGSIRLDSN